MYIICFCVFSTLSWNSLKIQRLENKIRLELMSVFTLTSSSCTQWEKKSRTPWKIKKNAARVFCWENESLT